MNESLIIRSRFEQFQLHKHKFQQYVDSLPPANTIIHTALSSRITRIDDHYHDYELSITTLNKLENEFEFKVSSVTDNPFLIGCFAKSHLKYDPNDRNQNGYVISLYYCKHVMQRLLTKWIWLISMVLN
jgi:hypothetical protein